jgi:hypothetical protein
LRGSGPRDTESITTSTGVLEARSMKKYIIAVSLLILSALPSLAGVAGSVKTAQGESYWSGDPGPIDPGSYWTSGQYKYDPNGYMERNRFDSDQNRLMTVYAEHSGRARCVFRARVVVSNWDFNHPYLRVCRPEGGPLKAGE